MVKIEGIEKSSFHERKQDENYARRGNPRCQSFKIENSLQKRQLSLRQPCLKLSTWWNCWKKWTQQVLPQQRPWLTARPYCVRMLLKKGTDRDRLFKNVPEKDNYYIKVPAILEDGGDA